jgi:hypothetical protein
VSRNYLRFLGVPSAERDGEPRRPWAGIGVAASIELGIGIAVGFAIVSLLGAIIVWFARLFD